LFKAKALTQIAGLFPPIIAFRKALDQLIGDGEHLGFWELQSRGRIVWI
jgi:hypothetical protein